MSQTFIMTTEEQLQKIIGNILTSCSIAQMPSEVVELEKLLRKEYLTTEEVEKIYPLKGNTLRKDRINGKGPAFSKLGDKVVYSQVAIRKYLESRRQKTHDQP
jgi:ribosomal protein S3AE